MGRRFAPLPIPAAAGLIFVLPATPAAPAADVPAPWSADPALVDDLSARRPEFNYREGRVPAYDLPPVLGASSDAESWESRRRPELLEAFRENVYGRVPEAAYSVTWEVALEDPAAMGGAATLRLVDVTCFGPSGVACASGSPELRVRLVLFVPNSASKPVPATLLICNRDPENIDATRAVKSPFWPAEEIVARGYAAAAFHNGDVDPDRHDGWRDGAHALLEPDPALRAGSSWGTIAAWAWGASRCLDYLVADDGVDGSRVVLVGHSRGGKTALWAAAEDRRFAMAVSNESGCGGAALSRRGFGETVARINASFPHWFCGNFHGYGGRAGALPVDQHQLIALVAPRAVYVASAAADLWADPRGEFLALAHASPAFELYGHAGIDPAGLPQLDVPVTSGRQAYHIRPGKHDLTPADWMRFLDFADSAVR